MFLKKDQLTSRRLLKMANQSMGNQVSCSLIIHFMVKKHCIGKIMQIVMKFKILSLISKVGNTSGRDGHRPIILHRCLIKRSLQVLGMLYREMPEHVILCLLWHR